MLLFFFFFFSSHTPLWGFTLGDDEGWSLLYRSLFFFDWCSFRISCRDECCYTAAKSETFLTALQLFLFPPPCPATAPIPLCVFTEGGGWSSNELSAALTDCGHFNNLAFFKSPLQSAKKSFPSQFITSCLPWTCLVYTNYVFQGRGRLIGLYTSTIISMKY